MQEEADAGYPREADGGTEFEPRLSGKEREEICNKAVEPHVVGRLGYAGAENESSEGDGAIPLLEKFGVCCHRI